MESTAPGTDNPSSMPISMPPVENGNPIPYWHTAVLLSVLVVFSIGNMKSSQAVHAGPHVRIYLATMIYEWLLTAFVWWGLRRSGGSLRELIGGRWHSIGDFFLDIVIAMGVWLGALMVIALAAFAMGMNHPGNLSDAQKHIGFLAPQNKLEILLWVGLSSTAGFCEEVLFRGYFQKQFTRLLRCRWIALVAVSILFGLGHGYEGVQRMVLIAVLGFAFGLMSILRKSLRPAMMAHTIQDTISGLLLRALPH